MIPLLKSNEGLTSGYNPLGRKIDNEEDSWISSLVSIGAIIGSFVAGYLAERYYYFIQNHASYCLFELIANCLKICNKNSLLINLFQIIRLIRSNHAIWQYFTEWVER